MHALISVSPETMGQLAHKESQGAIAGLLIGMFVVLVFIFAKWGK